MLDEIAGEMPEEFFVELHRGIILQPQVKVHPEARAEDLYILGEYCRNRQTGNCILIYYGSFERVWGHLSREKLRERLRKTVLHEFRHHLEGRAGERGLEVEDAIKIHQYKTHN